MNKIIKSTLVAGAIAMSASSAFAGLTLCSVNTGNIDVTCNGNKGIPIKGNQCLTDLPWTGIANILKAKTGTCTFSIDGTQIGSAPISIIGSFPSLSGVVTSVTITPNQPYKTDPDPSSFPLSGQNIKVTIEHS